MLKKEHISAIKTYSDAWYTARLAKFTSSSIHFLTYPTGFTEGTLNYIRRKVGEELTGESAEREIETDATRWGHFHEAEAINRFGLSRGLEFLVVQQLITDPETRFGSTPDALIVLRESPDGTEYEVEPVEVKCPPTYDAYISLFECNTPTQVKKAKREYYWQVLDQMDQCGAVRGHFVVRHPKFKVGNHKAIVFDAMAPVLVKKRKTFPLYEDLKLLRERKQKALDVFDEIRSRLMAVPAM